MNKVELVDRFGGAIFDRIQNGFLKLDAKRAEEKGMRLGRLFYVLDKKHRLRTRDNLRIAFPDWTDQKINLTSKKVYEHFGTVLSDFLRTPLRTDKSLIESILVEDRGPFDEAIAMGKGVLIVTAHFGNWERIGHVVVSQGYGLTAVARDANQNAVQGRVQSLREMTGMTILSRGDSARGLIRALRANTLVAMLPDQNDDEVFVPFFGKPCGTVLGPAVLQQRTKCALLPAYCVRTGTDQYRVIIRPLINPELKETDLAVVTAKWMSELESVIKEYPEQYLWLHDRWKSARQRGML